VLDLEVFGAERGGECDDPSPHPQRGTARRDLSDKLIRETGRVCEDQICVSPRRGMGLCQEGAVGEADGWRGLGDQRTDAPAEFADHSEGGLVESSEDLNAVILFEVTHKSRNDNSSADAVAEIDEFLLLRQAISGDLQNLSKGIKLNLSID
jgi:hypothetical protein